MKHRGKIFLLAICILMMPSLIFAQTLDELNTEIKNKQEEITQIKKEAAIYQKNIRVKQEEAASLKNQLSILENKIAKTNLDVKSTKKEIEQGQLETRNIELQILSKQDAIDNQKLALTNILQEIRQNDQENTLKIFLMNDSLSDFFNETEYTKDLQQGLQETLGNLKSEKKLLLAKKNELENKQKELLALNDQLELEKIELIGQTDYKENLLVSTKNSEQKFTELFWQAKEEQESISSSITVLEKQARQKLDQLKTEQPKLTDSQLSWPVPKNKITAYFHDPDYPFRYLFEHPAIDIRAKQGTPIAAPAEGYVLTAKDAGMGYSYIALIHANGISTVYGHVSKIFVREDEYVAKGEIIGLSGAMPGTPGAGRLTTGPHLHFEVRVNGIPVNPLDYLP